MRYCFFGKSVLFIQERKRNRFGVVCLFKYFGHLGAGGGSSLGGADNCGELREKSSAGDTPPFLCPRAPRPPSAAARSGRPSRRVWAVGSVGASRWRLGHSPCPATHAHTLLHSHTLHFRCTHSFPRHLLHTPTRTPYATHLPVDSALVRSPRQQNAWSAEWAPGFAEQAALRRHPSSPSLPVPAATAVIHPRKPTLRRCALPAPERYSRTHT